GVRCIYRQYSMHMTAMNTPKKRAFICPNINIKTSTFSIYLAVKMMGIHDANNQNATNKNCNAFFIIPPTINVQ
ncbi:hypothetical protein RNO54_26740, partial [Escherichia coli]|uniref:hypothetical protein n=4 Tax=Escherichia coli TaxID=562 RepID=UPI001F4BAA0F